MAWRNSGPFLRALVVGVWLLVALGLILWRDPDFWRSPDDLYQKSATLEKQGSLQQASAVLDQLLQRTPRDPGLWVRKGYLELQASRLENAHRSFGTALSLSSGNIEASLGLAETASRLKDPSSAWKALNSLDPWSLEPGQLRRRAQLLAGMGRFSEALQDQRRLISLMPEDPQVLLEGARLAAAARDWEQAAALAARARDLSGDRALRQAAGELMAQSLHAMGRLEEAASAYDRIAGPENLDVRAQLAMQSKRFSVAAGLYGELAASRPDDRGVLGELARALQLSGNLTASASAYRNLLRAGDPDGRVRIRYAWVLNSLGRYPEAWEVLSPLRAGAGDMELLEVKARTALWSGRLEEAARLYRLWSAARPAESALQKDLALILERIPDRPGAIEIYARLVGAGKADRDVCVHYAWLLNEDKRYAEALEVLRSTPRQPQDLELLALRAQTAHWAGRHEEASTLSARLLESRPGDAEAWRLLAESQLRLGRHAEAERAMRQYSSLRPDDFPRRREFAEALAGAGQLDPAIRHYRELLASSSAADADLLRALAQLHERAGNAREALQLYLRAIDGLRPPDPELYLKAARLFRRTSRPEESLRWYRSYLGSAADPVGRNMAGTELAEALLDAGDPAAALAQARSVQAEAPADAASLLIAARAASQSNQPQLAAGYLEALGELRPLTRAEKTWLAGQLRAAGDAQQALILYNRILVEGPSADPEILEAAGDLRADSGDFAGALKAYLQLQSLEPDPRHSAKIAWVAAGAGQIDSADRAYSDYLQARPDDVGVRLDAARFLAASGNFGRAVEYYERVVSLRGPEGLRLELALSCLGARRYGDAETWAREALQHGESEERSRITLAQSLHLQGSSRDADRVLREMLIPTPQQPEATAWLARVAMALDRHLESFRLSERALHLGASEPGELWMLHGEAARKRADYGRARTALERAAGAGFDPVRLDAARENLSVGLRPSAGVPFSINEDSNDLHLAQAGISALLRLTPGIPLTAQLLMGELTQRGARFTRAAGLVAIPQVLVTPELGLHLRAGMEDYRSGGSLFVWEAGGRYFFRDTSEIGVGGLRESLWSGYDRREPREFNRVTGLEALGPDFHVHTVRAYIDKASGGGRRLRLESGASGYQDGNDRVFLYGHYQVPLSDRAGNWTVVAPNLYFETFADRSPSYFSPDRFVTLGGMLHTIRRAPDNRWRVEGEVNPRLVSSDGRRGFGIHAVLDFSVLAGPVELGAGGFVFYEELNDYRLWRISGGIRVPVGRAR